MYKNGWKNIPSSFILFAAFGILLAQPASAMLISSCQYESFVFNQSDYVVEGQLEKVETINESGTFITILDLKISKEIKRTFITSPSFDSVQVRIPGGEIGGVRLWAEDFPTFTKDDEGKKYRFYLAKSEDSVYPVCAGFGIVELNAPEPAPVVPPHVNDSVTPASNVSKTPGAGTPDPSGNPAYLFAAPAAVLVAAAAAAYFVLRGKKKQG